MTLEMSKCIYKYLDYKYDNTKMLNALKNSRNGPNSKIQGLKTKQNLRLDKLQTPHERRQEMKTIKSAMDSMNALSKEIGFTRKRA